MAPDTVELIHLPIRNPVPSLGSHRFTLRSGSQIEEIAIMIDDVLYYTLPCIATLVFPEPDKWKKFWETVYRSLMPHRDSISECGLSPNCQLCDRLTAIQVPGPLSSSTRSPESSGSPRTRCLTRCSDRRLREVLAVHPEDQTDLLPVSTHQKGHEEKSLRDPLLLRTTPPTT